MTRIFIIFLTVILTALTALAEPELSKEAASDDLVSRYEQALSNQKDALKDTSMEVLMEGKIPKLKKEGKMSAMKLVSSLGGVTWKLMGFWGDDTVKKEVMARYMKLEQDASNGEGNPGELSISPKNYNFKYKGVENRNGLQVHVLELKPKHKRVGLFKGELWLDPSTYLPVREVGRLVKNPSIFIKRMEFVRDYEIRDGVSYLKRMESRTDTRIVGRAELNIEYATAQKSEPAAEPVSGPVEEARDASIRLK